MKTQFPGFYSQAAPDGELLAEGSVVVFDANVLLNLYRYPAGASADLLALMEKISQRVWIPFQAALEYQRNRLEVIAEQKRRFREVRKVLAKTASSLDNELAALQLRKRHSTIDTTLLLNEISTAKDKFDLQLGELERSQRDVFDADSIRERLDAIFESRIGSPPVDQAWLDKIAEEGRSRYKFQIPPGYRDQAKEGEVFSHNGLL